jgi:hypothetical protein
VLAVQDPLPPGHVSALSISSDSLAEASQELYQISPAEILDRPGTYTIRLTLFGHVTAPER